MTSGTRSSACAYRVLARRQRRTRRGARERRARSGDAGGCADRSEQSLRHGETLPRGARARHQADRRRGPADPRARRARPALTAVAAVPVGDRLSQRDAAPEPRLPRGPAARHCARRPTLVERGISARSHCALLRYRRRCRPRARQRSGRRSGAGVRVLARAL